MNYTLWMLSSIVIQNSWPRVLEWNFGGFEKPFRQNLNFKCTGCLWFLWKDLSTIILFDFNISDYITSNNFDRVNIYSNLVIFLPCKEITMTRRKNILNLLKNETRKLKINEFWYNYFIDPSNAGQKMFIHAIVNQYSIWKRVS